MDARAATRPTSGPMTSNVMTSNSMTSLALRGLAPTAFALLACGLGAAAGAATPPVPATAPAQAVSAKHGGPVRPSIIAEHGELQIRFPVGVQAWDATDVTRRVQVSPALDCAWRWVDDRRLACDPEGVEVGRRYTVRLAAGLRALDGRAVEPGEAVLVPDPLRISMDVNGWDEALPRVRVHTWQAVDLPREHLASALTWYRGTGFTPVRPEDLTAETSRDGRTTAWRVALPADLARPERLTLGLRGGFTLPGVETPVEGAPALIVEAGLPLRITGAGCLVEASGCPRYSRVALRFSRMPGREALEAALPEGLALEALHTDWSRDRSDPAMRLSPAIATLRVLAPVGARVPVDLGGLLDPPAEGEPAGWSAGALVVGPAAPTLRIDADEQRLAPGEAPRPAWRATGTPATRQAWTRIDARGMRSGEARLPAVAAGEERVLPAHPASVRRLQRRGGLLLVALEDREHPMAAQALAWTAHAITVHRSGDEWLAWVTRFDDAAPVAGLRVDWLARDDGRVLGGATTDADGVARLRLPAGDDAPTPGFVRAGGAVASVLRLQEWRGADIEASAGEGPEPGWGERGPRFSLGLTDRPYARPGEAVHYVLWARRAERLGALAPEPFAGEVTLALERAGNDGSAGDAARLRWTVAATPDGRLAGRLVLPGSLPDGLWCIRPLAADADTRSRWRRRADADHGACLRVGGAEARSTWLALTAPEGVLRPGQSLAVGLEGGFLSGGPAAEGEVRVSADIAAASPAAPDDPALADFRFLDQPGDAAEPRAADLLEAWPAEDAPLRLDAAGRAALAPRIRADAGAAVPAFATLSLRATLEGRDGTASGAPARQVRVALAERYVGLKHRLDDDGRGRWEAVVVDAAGRAVADAGPVRIAPVERPTGGDPVACVLADTGPGRCPALDALLARHWSLEVRASAAGAHAVRMPVWRWGWDRGDGVRVEAGPAAADGARALTLVQPWSASRWLLVVEHEGVLATHRVDARGPRATWTLPWDAAWPAQVRLTAIAVAGDAAHAAAVAEAADAADAGAAAPGRPVQATSLTLVGPAAPSTAATLGFERDRAAPGDTVGLRLHNPGTAPLRLSVSVVDEGLLALDPAHAAREPQASDALAAWRAPRQTTGRIESLLLMARGANATPRFSDWRSRGDRSAAAPPADFAPEDFRVSNDSPALERVEVTGSRLRRADIEPVVERPAAAAPARGDPPDAGAGAGPVEAPAALRLRQRFDDLAAWHDGLTLAPGETRVLDVALPDGLTRWRARAWAEAPDGAIALSEATLEASLPLEARLSVPASLRRGDRARLTLSLRERERDAALADTRIEARGAGVDAARDAMLALRRDVQARAALDVQPEQTGRLEVTGIARRDGAADGVLRGAPVLADAIDERWSQAFWAGTDHAGLSLPALPPGAEQSRLQVRVGRLGSALAAAWEGDLHAYPHRCIEQRLSRAIGAALALERNGGADWPEAQATIDEAYRELRGHIDGDGGVHAWPGGARAADSDGERGGSPVLAAWVLRTLDALEALGHAPPDASVRPQLLGALERWRDRQAVTPDTPRWSIEALAEVESVLATAGRADPELAARLRARLDDGASSDWLLAALWRGAAGDAAAREALRPRLLAALGTDAARMPSDARWMGSLRRDACVLLEAAAAGDAIPADALLAPTRRLADLWSGGHDSHAGATCLLALRAARARLGDDGAAVALRVAIDGVERPLALPAGKDDATLFWDDAPATGRLSIAAEGEAPALLGVVATRGWRAPARGLDAPAGLGLGVRRDYAVLRGGAWVPLRGALRQDEIVRVHLRIDAGATRHHVALVDAVPGGLEPVDPATTATPDGALARFADEAWGAFEERQTGRVEVKLYAGTLWPGTHDVYWYARARHVGEYLAVPAEASLMYGEASRGRSASAVIRIVEAPAAR